MSKQLFTKGGHDFYECASAFQKAIRRQDKKIAGYFGLELFMSGYKKYVWKRLLTVSAEDCDGIITKEIYALFESWMLINEGRYEWDKGRIFVSKAILILCDWYKSRDSDHLQCLVYDQKKGITDDEIYAFIEDARSEIPLVPEYTFDCHTMRGKRIGKTKQDFFRSEVKYLAPTIQKGLFDDLVE